MQMTGSTPTPGSQQHRRPDASMLLINELLAAPIDPGYAAAARRRREAAGGGDAAPASVRARIALLVAALVIGLSFGTAVTNLRLPAKAWAAERSQLAARVEAANVGLTQRSERLAALRAQITRLQDARSGAGGQELADRAAALEVQSALVAVRGPGLTVTLDDSPPAAGDTGSDEARRGGQFAQGRVVSRDLQAVVNALWAAGAEAVAINGHRLTATTAIRFAGQAILVGYRPLTRPYVVNAVGSPELTARFERGLGGDYLRELSTVYGAPTSVSAVKELSLPGATTVSPRYAVPEPSSALESVPQSPSSAPPRKDSTP